jgi:seryl-tRNA(Sec) selenium transferase
MKTRLNIYERLGVRTIINAKGPATRLSGGLMAAEVASAMQEATQHCVDMTELQTRAVRSLLKSLVRRQAVSLLERRQVYCLERQRVSQGSIRPR